MRMYLAGPLFSLAEQAFNRALADAITAADPSLAVTLPQDNAKSFVGAPGGNRAIFEDCLRGVQTADVVLAVLDGADADSGTAVEVGYALALGKQVIGLRTDFRAGEDRGVNLMLAYACSEFVQDPGASLPELADRIVAFCRDLASPAERAA